MQADLAEVGASLREAVKAGSPAAAFLAAWPTLNDEDPHWQALIEEITRAGASLHPSIATAVAIHPEAVATALVDRSGRAWQTHPRFESWIGDPSTSAEVRRLVAKAVADESAIGLVSALDGRVLSLFARLRSERSPWAPLAPAHSSAGDARDCVLLVAFSPSKSSTLAARAATALGLTPLEAKIAEALLDTPNLAAAADSIGVGRETAKDALGRAMRKAGVGRAAQFVGRIVDLSCEADREQVVDPALLGRAMELTPAESRVAVGIAGGAAAKEIAGDLGLAEETVKSYRRAIFLKTGVNRSRDLRRLISEVAELDRLASASEVKADAAPERERLKMIAAGERRVAFIDYGPASGEPLVVGHGFTTGRLAPIQFLKPCQAAGLRVIIPQRPGFGLTSPAHGDFLATGADDLAAVLDSLGLAGTRLLARDGGAATMLAFAARHPGRLKRPLLLNPRPPRGYRPPPAAPMSAISRALLDRPGLVEPFAEMLRRQTRSDVVEAMLRRTCSTVEADRRLIEDPAVLAHLVRDMQGLMARTVRGFVDEQNVYSHGWSPPGLTPDADWTVVYAGALWPDPDMRPWAGLPGLRTGVLEGAGHMAAFSHVDELLRLLLG